jgi:uncharacterized membrane protein YccF (DUF307 family)
MRTLGNILWFILAGFWLAIAYAVTGIIACVFIITIPFGIAAFRLAGYVIWPFGRVVVDRREGAPVLTFIANVLWFIFAGLWLAIAQFVFGVLLFVTIIGIPMAVASWKMVPLAIAPLGRRVVSMDSLEATSGRGVVMVPSQGTRA